MPALTHSDRDAFVAAILADPADDVPRLVYADWLDEHSCPERAEFIRVQCEIARCGRCGGDGQAHGADRPFEWSGPGTYPAPDWVTRVEALRRRERELWTASVRRAVAFAWDMGAGRMCRPHLCDTARGFVESFVGTWEEWRDHAAVIRAAQPVTRVRLTTVPTLMIRDDPLHRACEFWLSSLDHRRFTIRYLDLANSPRFGASLIEDRVKQTIAAEYPGIEFEWLRRARYRHWTRPRRR